MTHNLKTAIENLLTGDPTPDKIQALEKAYRETPKTYTDTQNRIEFLRKCLEKGMSKRDAARELVKSDIKISLSSAETIVYTAFSGRYQVSQRGRRVYTLDDLHEPVVDTTIDIKSDEDLI